jgi:hypothetical protein
VGDCSARWPGSKDGSQHPAVTRWPCPIRRSRRPRWRALVGAGADILSIAESRRTLEDVYLELIDEDVEARRR